jgi:hypothetical protein
MTARRSVLLEKRPQPGGDKAKAVSLALEEKLWM